MCILITLPSTPAHIIWLGLVANRGCQTMRIWKWVERVEWGEGGCVIFRLDLLMCEGRSFFEMCFQWIWGGISCVSDLTWNTALSFSSSGTQVSRFSPALSRDVLYFLKCNTCFSSQVQCCTHICVQHILQRARFNLYVKKNDIKSAKIPCWCIAIKWRKHLRERKKKCDFFRRKWAEGVPFHKIPHESCSLLDLRHYARLHYCIEAFFLLDLCLRVCCM